MRVSEVYASVQGEGPNVGRTTVFTRFGGCNLRCPGWPCDTQHAIDPAYRNEWNRQEPEGLRSDIVLAAQVAGASLITLTGGEPFLQPDAELRDLTFELSDAGYGIDCFSNGTIEYPEWVLDKIQFIVDWKLPGSGETFFGHSNKQRLANLEQLAISPLEQSVKFVIKDYTDYVAARSLYDKFKDLLDNFEVFYGRVWESDITDAYLTGLVMTDQLPWRLNRQEHNYIWPPNERGR